MKDFLQSIISLKSNIAIFDLVKTILKQKVFLKSYPKNLDFQLKILKIFLTIIIALLTEEIIVVFKIAIYNYLKMMNALYLITGISLILISLTFFIFFFQKRYKIESK